MTDPGCFGSYHCCYTAATDCLSGAVSAGDLAAGRLGPRDGSARRAGAPGAFQPLHRQLRLLLLGGGVPRAPDAGTALGLLGVPAGLGAGAGAGPTQRARDR